MHMKHISVKSMGIVLSLGFVTAACSERSTDTDFTGGKPSTGGKGTSSGGALAGGSLSMGGNTFTGGSIGTGGSTTGSLPGMGGTPMKGGDITTGGVLASGGVPGSGGVTASGAASAGGGAFNTGGKISAGGSTATGGVAGMGGTVPSGPLAAMTMTPSNGAVNVCGDAILSITFNKPPVLKETGKVIIYNAASPGTPVETIESPGTLVTRAISGESFKMYPMTVIENTAYVLVRAGALDYGQTYYVTVDAGLITDGEGTSFSITGNNTWRFTTKSTKPSVTATAFTIAADGSGDLCTVMGAIDLIAAGNTTPRTLHIKNGQYPGLVDIHGKHNILLRGEDRFKTNLSHRNTEKMNTNKSYRMAYKVKKANDIVFENLTITNTTPAGGDGVQAEAITIEGNAQRIILTNVELKSYQDTFMADEGTQVYVKNSKIWGDTDFFWGGGTVYFDTCELMTRESGHQITNARTSAGANGFAFVNCKLTREFSDISNTSLGQTHGALDGNVAYINCRIDEHITGWKNLAKRDWEYGNTNLAGSEPKKFNGIQLTPDSPELALTSSPEKWLGWKPVLPGP